MIRKKEERARQCDLAIFEQVKSMLSLSRSDSTSLQRAMPVVSLLAHLPKERLETSPALKSALLMASQLELPEGHWSVETSWENFERLIDSAIRTSRNIQE